MYSSAKNINICNFIKLVAKNILKPTSRIRQSISKI